MMQSIRRFSGVMLLVMAFVTSGLGQTYDPMEVVCTMSQNLTAYSATIRMIQHRGGNDSVIEFAFDFVPPDRMRIVYTAPATVEGQTIILNADRFYTYIPSLHRSVWKQVGEDASNPGEDMGFLFDFVTGTASEALSQGVVDVVESPETFVLERAGVTLDVDAFALELDEERQLVSLNVLDAAPVAISIYSSESLVMEIHVLEYRINGDFDEAWFAIPEE